MKLRIESPLLCHDEPAAVTLVNAEGASAFVLLCDHASNRIPHQLGQLGLSAEQLHSHIAWDAGALAVAVELSTSIDAPLVHANYSRLVIDCNRASTDSDSVLAVSDGIAIAGNQNLDDRERQLRELEIFLPYHREIASLLDRRSHPAPLLLSIHSYNPVVQGRHRSWEMAVCYGPDRRLADLFLARLPGVSYALIGDNEPFDIDPAIDFTLPYHADPRGLMHVMLEIRRDCIATPQQVTVWAGWLARVCQDIVSALGH